MVVAVCAVWSFVNLAEAETFYRWRDGAAQLHVSNYPEGAPSNAQAMQLAESNIATGAPIPGNRSLSTESSGDRPVGSTSEASGCSEPNPGRLINAITSRLESRPSGVSPHSGLTLLVAATPVWYGPSTSIQLLPGDFADETPASEQAAIAYPRTGACPPVPPLERYAAAPFQRSGSPGLCADYRRASAEIDTAASRNQAVAQTFEFAATRFDSLRADGDASGHTRLFRSGSDLVQDVRLPTWLVEMDAASTTELATEIDEFSEELAVAREEIDRAARVQGCW